MLKDSFLVTIIEDKFRNYISFKIPFLKLYRSHF